MQTFLKVYALLLVLLGTTSMIQTRIVTDTIENSIQLLQGVQEMPSPESKPFLLLDQESLKTLHPNVIPYVKGHIGPNEARLRKLVEENSASFQLIDRIFEEQGIPREMKYLAIVESNMKSTAVSVAGAVGPWQFMPSTARNFGLKVNSSRDERKDLFKSTHAAAKYLKLLYSDMQDWLLVLASYNSGPGRVKLAMKKSGSRDFWKIQQYLPTESRNHVKKFIAIHYIMEGQGGITTTGADDVARLEFILPKIDLDLNENISLQNIVGRFHSAVIIKNLEMDAPVFFRLNPGFDQKVSLDSFALRLPEEKMKRFNIIKDNILDQSVQYLLAEANNAGSDQRYPREIALPPKRPVTNPRN